MGDGVGGWVGRLVCGVGGWVGGQVGVCGGGGAGGRGGFERIIDKLQIQTCLGKRMISYFFLIRETRPTTSRS